MSFFGDEQLYMIRIKTKILEIGFDVLVQTFFSHNTTQIIDFAVITFASQDRSLWRSAGYKASATDTRRRPFPT